MPNANTQSTVSNPSTDRYETPLASQSSYNPPAPEVAVVNRDVLLDGPPECVVHIHAVEEGHHVYQALLLREQTNMMKKKKKKKTMNDRDS
jgi:hypothetical protein